MPNINELTLAKELIKFPSVTPKDAGAIGHLAKQLKRLGFNWEFMYQNLSVREPYPLSTPHLT